MDRTYFTGNAEPAPQYLWNWPVMTGCEVRVNTLEPKTSADLASLVWKTRTLSVELLRHIK